MSQASRDAWRALLAQPLQFVRDECLDAALLGAVDSRQVRELARQPRFQPRILHLLASYYGLESLTAAGQVADEDLPVLLLPVERFAQLALFCGACQHATALAREIRGPVVQRLRGHLGNEVYDLAVSWHEVGAEKPVSLDEPALLAAIERDGLVCVNAWLAAQPTALQAWLRLRFDLAASDRAGNAANVDRVRQVAALVGSRLERGAA